MHAQQMERECPQLVRADILQCACVVALGVSAVLPIMFLSHSTQSLIVPTSVCTHKPDHACMHVYVHGSEIMQVPTNITQT
jgi:hypothetical protein